MLPRSIVTLAVLAIASPALAALGLPTSLSINFAGDKVSTDPADTGFDAAYNPTPDPNPSIINPTAASGFFIGPNPTSSYGTANMLNIWTDPGDIYGQYGSEPNSAENVFYSNLATSSETIVTANVIVQNLNQDYHGGGIWLGTDEDHYIRLGVIYNNGTANVEMLRENEDLWAPPGSTQNGGTNGLSGDGNDIADQQEVTPITSAGSYMNPVDIELELILTGSTARAQYSLDGGDTWLPVDSSVPYFAGVATSPADGATVQGGFKVGVFGFGGGSASVGEALVSFENFNANTYTLSNVEWNAGNGNASNTANFSNLTTTANMGNEGRVYEFGAVPGVTAHTTVTLDTGLNGTLDVGGLVFSSPNGYTIAGPQTLVVNGGLIDSEAGNNVISAPLTVSGYARIDSQIHVAAGSTLTLAGKTVPRLNSLVVDSGGQLDLTTNSVEIDYETPATDPFDSIEAMVKSGYNKGTWNGSGIISSSAAALNAGTGLAIIDTGVTSWPLTQMFGPHYVGSAAVAAATPNGSTNRDVLIMYTWLGDVNLDGTVNSADLSLMGTGTPGSQTWANGDFNYDNVVNEDDYSLFMLGNFVQNSVLAPAPEPAGTLLLILPALALAVRRRRSKQV